MDTVEVFQIMVGRTPMIARNKEEALDGLGKVLDTMQVGQKYPCVVTKVTKTTQELAAIEDRTPWLNWKS